MAQAFSSSMGNFVWSPDSLIPPSPFESSNEGGWPCPSPEGDGDWGFEEPKTKNWVLLQHYYTAEDRHSPLQGQTAEARHVLGGWLAEVG